MCTQQLKQEVVSLCPFCDTTKKKKSFILNNYLCGYLARNNRRLLFICRVSSTNAEVTNTLNKKLKLSEEQGHAQLNLLRGKSQHKSQSSSRGLKRIHVDILFFKSITLQ